MANRHEKLSESPIIRSSQHSKTPLHICKDIYQENQEEVSARKGRKEYSVPCW